MPAIGWHPTKVMPLFRAMSKHGSQMERFTPPVSITMASGLTSEAWLSSQSTHALG